MQEVRRRTKLKRAMAAAGVDGMLVTHGPDVRYLTGFAGSSGAVAITAGKAVLFTDGRYAAQAKAEAPGVRVVIDRKPPALLAVEWMVGAGVSQCGFDAGQTTVQAMTAMRKAVAVGRRDSAKPTSQNRDMGHPRPTKPGSENPDPGHPERFGNGHPERRRSSFFVEANGMVARLREVKDADEVARMKRAAALGCRIFEAALEGLRPGVPEMEMAAQMELAARRGGADGMSFETIVTSGARSALPHGGATTAKLPRRGFVTLDFGVLLDGYCSDMTRTVHLGQPSGRERDVYHSVLEAQVAAVGAVRAGVSCGDVDEAARSVLRQAGLEKEFSHSTGHGVGLEIHEGPRVAAKQEQKLEAGMVITIEPGVYLEGNFGVRIEDMVLVTDDGGEVMTAASEKQLLVIGG